MSDKAIVGDQTREHPALDSRFRAFAIQIAEGFAQAERGELIECSRSYLNPSGAPERPNS